MKSESLLKKVLRIVLVDHGGFSALCPVRFELPPKNQTIIVTHFLSRALNSVFHGGMTVSGNRPVTQLTVLLAVKASMLMLSWATNLWQRLQQKSGEAFGAAFGAQQDKPNQ